MNTEEAIAANALAKMLHQGASEEAVRLAAQLLGVAPCPTCDFYAKYCKCSEK